MLLSRYWNNCVRLVYVPFVQWLFNRQLSFHIRKCLLLLNVFGIYTLLAFFFIFVAMSTLIKKSIVIRIYIRQRYNMEKLYFSRCNVIPYLRQFLQRIRNYQLFNVYYFAFIQCDCIVICTILFTCYRCMFLQ